MFLIKKKVERVEKERFPGTKTAAVEKPFKLFNDGQDIAVWLDKDALTEKGWMLDITAAKQVKQLPSCASLCLFTWIAVGLFPR